MINGKPVLVNYQGTLYKDSSKKMEAEVTHQIDEQGRRESITYIRDVNKVGVTLYRKVGHYIGWRFEYWNSALFTQMIFLE